MATKFMYEDKELNFSSGLVNDSATSGSSLSTYSSAKILNLLALKQNNLNFDTTPTSNSNNPVTSAGVKTYVDSSVSNVQSNLNTVQTNLTSHTSNTSNPHSVTKAQVGLGDVENTALSTWTGSSNLKTCNQGDFGDVVTRSISHNAIVDYDKQQTTVPSYAGMYGAIVYEADVITDDVAKAYSSVKLDSALANAVFSLSTDGVLTITVTAKS